mmetsp:Transcript_14698/g.37118  ORF Transcript_14698/g.37118 Transcript_14698/m.37118 type:complete len:331 (+) Transcript_14698:359-1351(+)
MPSPSNCKQLGSTPASLAMLMIDSRSTPPPPPVSLAMNSPRRLPRFGSLSNSSTSPVDPSHNSCSIPGTPRAPKSCSPPPRLKAIRPLKFFSMTKTSSRSCWSMLTSSIWARQSPGINREPDWSANSGLICSMIGGLCHRSLMGPIWSTSESPRRNASRAPSRISSCTDPPETRCPWCRPEPSTARLLEPAIRSSISRREPIRGCPLADDNLSPASTRCLPSCNQPCFTSQIVGGDVHRSWSGPIHSGPAGSGRISASRAACWISEEPGRRTSRSPLHCWNSPRISLRPLLSTFTPLTLDTSSPALMSNPIRTTSSLWTSRILAGTSQRM